MLYNHHITGDVEICTIVLNLLILKRRFRKKDFGNYTDKVILITNK